MVEIKRGALVAWHREPYKPLSIASDPYDCFHLGGYECVTCRSLTPRGKKESQGIYRVDALIPYEDSKKAQ